MSGQKHDHDHEHGHEHSHEHSELSEMDLRVRALESILLTRATSTRLRLMH